MSNRNRIKTDTEVTGSLLLRPRTVASPRLGEFWFNADSMFSFRDVDGTKTFNTILSGSGVFSSSLQIVNLPTSSITNFDTEVSRSAASFGFGAGSPDLSGTNIVSSSAQTGSVLGLGPSDNVRFGTLQSVHGLFTGNVSVEGVLTAREIVVSSSVYYVTQSFSSGSTIFGDTLDDTHQFTGSVYVTGSSVFDGPFVLRNQEHDVILEAHQGGYMRFGEFTASLASISTPLTGSLIFSQSNLYLYS